jgi:hypothetical protein
MNDMPIVRLEIETLRHTILHAFNTHLDEIGELVKIEVEKICTEEYLKEEVKRQVGKVIPEIISMAINDYEVKSKLSNNIRELILKDK